MNNILEPYQINLGMSQVRIYFNDSKSYIPHVFIMGSESAKNIKLAINAALKTGELFGLQSENSDNELYFNPSKIATIEIVHGTRVDPSEGEE